MGLWESSGAMQGARLHNLRLPHTHATLHVGDLLAEPLTQPPLGPSYTHASHVFAALDPAFTLWTGSTQTFRPPSRRRLAHFLPVWVNGREHRRHNHLWNM